MNAEKIRMVLGGRHGGLLLIGIALSFLFWTLESAVHVVVFNDSDFIRQLYRLESHEIWMRLIVVIMFVGFGLYAQWIVTARKRAEEAAKRAHAELTQIFETAADGMRIVDKEYRVLRANETFLALSGATKEETLGKKCYEVFRGPLCHTPGCPLRRILRHEEWVEVDAEKERRDGVKVPCIVTATPFRDPEGELVGIVEDFKDISDRKRSEKEVLKSREQLRDLATHLQGIREKERAHIAREIHDELGQSLTALKMDLHWMRNKLPDRDESLIQKTDAISDLVDSTMKMVKKISSELRPLLLDDFGLSAAIEWQVEEFQERTGIPCELNSEPQEIVLDQAISIAVFRVVQEALTNVTRHADATGVEVSLKKEDGLVTMEVRDDGHGISKEHLLDPKSFGLIGMRERVHSFGGRLTIRGNPGEGTVVEAVLPIDGKGRIHD